MNQLSTGRQLISVALGAIVTGCAGHPRPAPDPQRAPVEWMTVLDSRPATEPASAERLCVAVEPQRRMVAAIASAQDPGATPTAPPSGAEPSHLFWLQSPSEADRRWTLRKAPIRAGAIEPDFSRLSELHMRTTPEGDVVLERSVEAADAVETSFDPPMLVLPAALDPAKPSRQRFTMTVHPIERPAEIQVEGRASRSIELIAIERLQTPAGEFQTQKIRSVLKAELGSANITVTNDSWFAPGIGLVAEEHRELVTVFGLAIRNTRERWGLESAAPGSADVLHRAPKRVKER